MSMGWWGTARRLEEAAGVERRGGGGTFPFIRQYLTFHFTYNTYYHEKTLDSLFSPELKAFSHQIDSNKTSKIEDLHYIFGARRLNVHSIPGNSFLLLPTYLHFTPRFTFSFALLSLYTACVYSL